MQSLYVNVNFCLSVCAVVPVLVPSKAGAMPSGKSMARHFSCMGAHADQTEEL